MELFDTLKECVRVAQQADNVPLVRELINAQTQVLDLVDENQKLREQIKKCKKQLTLLERLSGMKMPISRWLMTLISTFIARVAGTQKRCWYRGKRPV